MKSIAILFIDGFEEIEGITIADVLRRADFNTLLVGVEKKTVTGSHGITLTMDKLLKDVSKDDLDAVVLPGGMPGAARLAENSAVTELLKAVSTQKKKVGAICAAPIALHSAGLLNNKKVTCYPSFEPHLVNSICTGESVTIDGHIITGQGPGAALEFSLSLVEFFGKPEKSRELRKAMLVN